MLIEDYITAALPNLLDSLSAPIFLLLAGRINVEEVIDMIELEVADYDYCETALAALDAD